MNVSCQTELFVTFVRNTLDFMWPFSPDWVLHTFVAVRQKSTNKICRRGIWIDYTTDTTQQKKFNSPEFWWSILAVFFMLKTIPLTVFCYHLILLLFSSNFYVIKMDTWIKLIVVPFDYIETSIVQYSRIQGDSKKRSTALFSAWKIQ